MLERIRYEISRITEWIGTPIYRFFEEREIRKVIASDIEPILLIDGEGYFRVDQDEVIREGAVQSLDGGELQPIMGTDTIGDKPSSFSEERRFYNRINNKPGESLMVALRREKNEEG